MAEHGGHADATSTHPVAPNADAHNWVLAGRYRVVDRIGSGAMAEVFRAHDQTLNRDVAVKVFRTLADPDSETNGAARRELELQVLAQLSHPNLITLFDGSVSDDGPAFLALELVEGPNLAALLRDGPLAERQARAIGAQIADALAYVHERGMVHRDVKPANILLGTDDVDDPDALRARLSDFGIVRLVDSAQMTSADLTVGTAYYLAPEQARSANVGPAADVYALGLVLIETLTGVRSFDGPMHEILAARLTTAPAIPRGLPEPWPGLLAAMTAVDPSARPSAAEVARALRTGDATAATVALGGLPAGAGLGTAALGGMAGAAGAAGFANAPTVAGAALADMPTGVSPVAGSGPLPPPYGPSGPGNGTPGDPRRKRRINGLLVAALAFLAIAGIAGWMIFQPGSQPSDPTVNTPSTQQSTDRAAGTDHPRKHGRTGHHVVLPANNTSNGSTAAGHPGGRHRTSHAPSTPAAPSTTVSTDPAPSTSTAPPTTTRPTPTPSRSTSSSTSAPSTSSAPATSASNSSAPGSGQADSTQTGSPPPSQG